MSSLSIFTIGGSRNIGYLSSIRFLEMGATVTFLLRSPSVFDKDATIQKYVQAGSARLIKGDALNEADTRRAWTAAGAVDAVVFTVGTVPSGFSIRKGFTMSEPNLVTQCYLNLLCTMPATIPQPKIISLSSTGIGPTAFSALPLILKPLYATLNIPHEDKLGMERVAAHCAGWAWDTKALGEPPEDVMGGASWTQRAGLPQPGSLHSVLIIRAGFLTDGPCVADEVAKKGKGKMYRVSERETKGISISRSDVAHFVVDVVTRRWDEFGNKRVNMTY
ncbi:unnamed protein product [Mycena citricolor]|uniref:NAD(P)-binding domain-containing protein n=1 Tax=Mycena citricolor TaxID=2018698 RepID=A0AAD2HJH9_9AGAR|nr:unnamed protein product [Mycena citricolor]